jgi:methionyl-tRNA formyltransferase
VAAEELNLSTHVIDTFTGWTPPVPINLVVAVSFGLLVPPRILGLARYGGLNVHPSLLPDLRGPAPIEHAILQQRERTGVSIQTLHPKHFDQGTVLAQTPAPGILIPRNATATELESELATIGAQLLIEVLRSGNHLPPHQDISWYTGPLSHAPKTTKQDRHISFASSTLDEILAIQRALGNPWCMLSNGQRLLIHAIVPLSSSEIAVNPPKKPGLWIRHNAKLPIIRAKCGATAVVHSSTYSGGKTGQGNAKVMNMLSPKKVSNSRQDRVFEEDEWERIDEY